MSVKSKLVGAVNKIKGEKLKSAKKAPAKKAAAAPAKKGSIEARQRESLSDIARAKSSVSDIGVRDELRKDAMVLPKLRGEIAAEDAYERLQEANKEAAKKNYDEAQDRLKEVESANADSKRLVRDAAASATAVEDEVYVVTNPEDRHLEISYGGISYYLKPGENEIKPLVPGHTSKNVATFIGGQVAGLTFTKKEKKGAKDEESVSLSGSAISGVPDHIAAKLQGVQNPPAHERLQPVPVPNDVDKYGAATIAAMQEEHFKALKGETPDAKEYSAKLAKGPKSSAPAKRVGAKRRIAEEK